MQSFELATPAEGFTAITQQVREAVRHSGLENGAVLIYCPHTTAGITINENADPDVQRDLVLALCSFFPDRADYRHAEGNSAAHLKASLVGSSATVPVRAGALVLGTWQGIYFCEFDGPRRRTVYVQPLAGA